MTSPVQDHTVSAPYLSESWDQPKPSDLILSNTTEATVPQQQVVESVAKEEIVSNIAPTTATATTQQQEQKTAEEESPKRESHTTVGGVQGMVGAVWGGVAGWFTPPTKGSTSTAAVVDQRESTSADDVALTKVHQQENPHNEAQEQPCTAPQDKEVDVTADAVQASAPLVVAVEEEHAPTPALRTHADEEVGDEVAKEDTCGADQVTNPPSTATTDASPNNEEKQDVTEADSKVAEEVTEAVVDRIAVANDALSAEPIEATIADKKTDEEVVSLPEAVDSLLPVSHDETAQSTIPAVDDASTNSTVTATEGATPQPAAVAQANNNANNNKFFRGILPIISPLFAFLFALLFGSWKRGGQGKK